MMAKAVSHQNDEKASEIDLKVMQSATKKHSKRNLKNEMEI